jgi:F-type H+-transporting ATPase subunit g
VATFQSYYQGLFTSLRQPSKLLDSLVKVPSNLSAAQMAVGGILFAECLGFFTIGEMLGRFKLVGYHGEVGHHH